MTDRELLVEQLASALADAAAGRDDYFEVAALAGLLMRFAAAGNAAGSAEPAILARVRALREDGTLQAVLPAAATASDLVESILEAPADYDELDRRELLLDLDELCAGACFVGEPNHFAAATRTLASAIAASPAAWRAQCCWVAQVLSSAPPLPEDCMLEVFHRIAAADADAEPLGANLTVRSRPDHSSVDAEPGPAATASR
jgi:hypothetical protein